MMTANARSARKTVSDLFGVAAPDEAAGLQVVDITLDSRLVTPGATFIAVPGIRGHGLDFLAQAVALGATAVAWEPVDGRSTPVIAPPAVCFPVERLRSRLGRIADRFFDHPSQGMDVVGVTGTNGKTTCAHLIATALEHLGRTAGYMGTVGIGRPGRLSRSELTTANVVETHRRLASLKQAGADAAALEVSSHALDQGRVDAVRFRIAAFTNLSRDHLDYHGDMDAYGRAKKRLFSWPGLEWAIANTDDPLGASMLGAVRPGTRTMAVARAGSLAGTAPNLSITAIEADSAGLRVSLHGEWGEIRIASPLLGRFNAENLALALAVLLAMDVEADRAAEALGAAQAPPGRMELFQESPDGPAIVVDYAHTPDALAKAIAAAREHFTGRIVTVFGCGGDRDKGKRPQMGRAAEAGSDLVFVTDDNPRGEAGDAIVADILEGMEMRPIVERDRAAAIEHAWSRAVAGDVVLVAGKGHEEYQIVGDERHGISDRRIAMRLTGGDA
jgi:UDP-N-acetylmuramoyl-L-alanyl-D-glutamate--2,6-diaminopimelate ligase